MFVCVFPFYVSCSFLVPLGCLNKRSGYCQLSERLFKKCFQLRSPRRCHILTCVSGLKEMTLKFICKYAIWLCACRRCYGYISMHVVCMWQHINVCMCVVRIVICVMYAYLGCILVYAVCLCMCVVCVHWMYICCV